MRGWSSTQRVMGLGFGSTMFRGDRLDAVRALWAGTLLTEVGAQVGVSRQSVYSWVCGAANVVCERQIGRVHARSVPGAMEG